MCVKKLVTGGIVGVESAATVLWIDLTSEVPKCECEGKSVARKVANWRTLLSRCARLLLCAG